MTDARRRGRPRTTALTLAVIGTTCAVNSAALAWSAQTTPAPHPAPAPDRAAARTAAQHVKEHREVLAAERRLSRIRHDLAQVRKASKRLPRPESVTSTTSTYPSQPVPRASSAPRQPTAAPAPPAAPAPAPPPTHSSTGASGG